MNGETVASKKIKEPPPKVKINVNIPKGHSMHKSVDLGKFRVGQPSKMTFHGKIKSVSQSDYDEGKSFEMQVDRMDIGGKGEGPKTMKDDMAKIKKERTMGVGDLED